MKINVNVIKKKMPINATSPGQQIKFVHGRHRYLVTLAVYNLFLARLCQKNVLFDSIS
jgi:hypothetical protein